MRIVGEWEVDALRQCYRKSSSKIKNKSDVIKYNRININTIDQMYTSVKYVKRI